MSDRVLNPLHPDVIEYAYRRGFFPMPHPETGEVLWFDPDPRTIIPLDEFHISRSLRRSRNARGYRVSFDEAFLAVVDGCANRTETWINAEFKAMYRSMYERGVAHSVEVWHGSDLVGGVYGLNFNGVFNAESMFSKATDASKVALWALIEEMQRQGLVLLETQFMTPHLKSLGAIEISKHLYHDILLKALSLPVTLVKITI